MQIIKSTCEAMSKTKSCNQHKEIKQRGKVLNTAKLFEIKCAFKFVDYSFDYPQNVLAITN